MVRSQKQKTRCLVSPNESFTNIQIYSFTRSERSPFKNERPPLHVNVKRKNCRMQTFVIQTAGKGFHAIVHCCAIADSGIGNNPRFSMVVAKYRVIEEATRQVGACVRNFKPVDG